MRFALFAVLVAGAMCAASAAPVNRQELLKQAATTTTTDKTAALTKERAVAVNEPVLLEQKETVATTEEAVVATKEEAVVLEKEKEQTVPLPEPTCVNNATHCSCMGQVYYPIIMIPDTAPPVCYQDPLPSKSFKCDCAGTALCEIETFPCTKLQPLQDVVPNQKFYCEPTESECKKLTYVKAPVAVEEVKEQKEVLEAPATEQNADMEKLADPVTTETVTLAKRA